MVRHRDRPGVLAQVLDAIKAEQINVQEMENIVFEGAEAAVARINLDKAPSGATLDRLRAGNEDIIELNVLVITNIRSYWNETQTHFVSRTVDCRSAARFGSHPTIREHHFERRRAGRENVRGSVWCGASTEALRAATPDSFIRRIDRRGRAYRARRRDAHDILIRIELFGLLDAKTQRMTRLIFGRPFTKLRIFARAI